jgi:hypothetical protein
MPASEPDTGVPRRPERPGSLPGVPAGAGPEGVRGRLKAPSRRTVALIILPGILLFLLVSGLLARFLSVENLERDSDLALVQAQARGDAASMFDQLTGCRADRACALQVQANVSNARLRRAGEVKIISLESPTAYALDGATGRTRLAWTVVGTPPVVQCIAVRRTGNFLSGVKIALLSISAPIENEGSC